MFINIDVERAKNRMSIKELARKANMKYETLLAKLNGKSEFTRSEMLEIQKVFGNSMSLEILFADDMNEQSA